MFGKGMTDMVANMLGMSPDEMQEQIQNAVANAHAVKETMETVARTSLNNQRLIYHKLTRVEKMLECIMKDRGLTIDEDVSDGQSRIEHTPH